MANDNQNALHMIVEYTSAQGQAVRVQGTDPQQVVDALALALGRNPFTTPPDTQPSNTADEKTVNPVTVSPSRSESESEYPQESEPELEPEPKRKKRGRPRKSDTAEPSPVALAAKPAAKSKPKPEHTPEQPEQPEPDPEPEAITLDALRQRSEDLIAALGMRGAREWLQAHAGVTKLKALTENQFEETFHAMGERIREADDAAEAEGRARVWPHPRRGANARARTREVDA